jgi:hypothetical protein
VSLIHINVRPAGQGLPSWIVETSTDGAGWAEQYLCGPPDNGKGPRWLAEQTARIFANGCRYAGADVRMTSAGAELMRV